MPPGVDEGTRLRLSGEGEAGIAGGPPGDLYVVISMKPHPLFERDGQDLHCQVPITFVQAALGAEIEVPTLEGKVKLRIPEGTQIGQGDAAARQGPALAALDRARRPAPAPLRRGSDAAHASASASCSRSSRRRAGWRSRRSARASSTSCASSSNDSACAELRLAPVPLAVALLALRGGARAARDRASRRASARPTPRRWRRCRRDPAGAERRLSEFLEQLPGQLARRRRAGSSSAGSRCARGDREAALTRFRAVRRRATRTATAADSRARRAGAARGRARPARGGRQRARARAHLEARAGRTRVAYRVLAEVASDPVASLRWRSRLRAEETEPGARSARIDAELDRALDGLSAAGPRPRGGAARRSDPGGPRAGAARRARARAGRLGDGAARLGSARGAAARRARRRPRGGGGRAHRAIRGAAPSTPRDLPTFAQAAQAPAARHLGGARERSASCCRSRVPSRASARRACRASCWPQASSAGAPAPAPGPA